MMFDEHGQPVFGRLNTDRPHQFKTQFIYQFPIGTSLGLNQYVASGVPITRDIAIVTGHSYPVQYLGRGSDGRTDVFSQTDLLCAARVPDAGQPPPPAEPQRAQPVRPADGDVGAHCSAADRRV